MSFTKTVVSKKGNFIPGSGAELTGGRALFGTDYPHSEVLMGIVKSVGYANKGEKKVLTNNMVPDTIVYAGLGKELSYEVAWKNDRIHPEMGDLMRLPVPIRGALSDQICVVDSFELKFSEGEFTMATLKVTYDAGMFSTEATGADVANSVAFTVGTLNGTIQGQPSTNTGIPID